MFCVYTQKNTKRLRMKLQSSVVILTGFVLTGKTTLCTNMFKLISLQLLMHIW